MKQEADICFGLYDFTGGYTFNEDEFLADEANWLIPSLDDSIIQELLNIGRQMNETEDAAEKNELLKAFYDLLVDQGVKIGGINECYLVKAEYGDIVSMFFQRYLGITALRFES